MTKPADLPALLESFFTQRLIAQRRASPHTVASYRDTSFAVAFCSETIAPATVATPHGRLECAVPGGILE